MSTHEPDAITARMRAEEAKLRKRSTLLTLIPVAVAIGLIAVTTQQVSTAKADLAATTDSLDTALVELEIYTEQALRKRAEVDSLAKLTEAYTSVLDSIAPGRATATETRVIDEFALTKTQGTVHVHVDSEGQLRQAQEIQRVLAAEGFATSVEVVEQGPKTSQVRFFRAEDRPGAEAIVNLARQRRLSLELRDLSRAYSGSRSTIAPGTYEIWMASGQD